MEVEKVLSSALLTCLLSSTSREVKDVLLPVLNTVLRIASLELSLDHVVLLVPMLDDATLGPPTAEVLSGPSAAVVVARHGPALIHQHHVGDGILEYLEIGHPQVQAHLQLLAQLLRMHPTQADCLLKSSTSASRWFHVLLHTNPNSPHLLLVLQLLSSLCCSPASRHHLEGCKEHLARMALLLYDILKFACWDRDLLVLQAATGLVPQVVVTAESRGDIDNITRGRCSDLVLEMVKLLRSYVTAFLRTVSSVSRTASRGPGLKGGGGHPHSDTWTEDHAGLVLTLTCSLWSLVQVYPSTYGSATPSCCSLYSRHLETVEAVRCLVDMMGAGGVGLVDILGPGQSRRLLSYTRWLLQSILASSDDDVILMAVEGLLHVCRDVVTVRQTVNPVVNLGLCCTCVLTSLSRLGVKKSISRCKLVSSAGMGDPARQEVATSSATGESVKHVLLRQLEGVCVDCRALLSDVDNPGHALSVNVLLLMRSIRQRLQECGGTAAAGLEQVAQGVVPMMERLCGLLRDDVEVSLEEYEVSLMVVVSLLAWADATHPSVKHETRGTCTRDDPSSGGEDSRRLRQHLEDLCQLLFQRLPVLPPLLDDDGVGSSCRGLKTTCRPGLRRVHGEHDTDVALRQCLEGELQCWCGVALSVCYGQVGIRSHQGDILGSLMMTADQGSTSSSPQGLEDICFVFPHGALSGDEVKVHGHRAIIAGRCPALDQTVMRAAERQGGRGGSGTPLYPLTVSLKPGIDPGALLAFLRYLYTGTAHLVPPESTTERGAQPPPGTTRGGGALLEHGNPLVGGAVPDTSDSCSGSCAVSEQGSGRLSHQDSDSLCRLRQQLFQLARAMKVPAVGALAKGILPTPGQILPSFTPDLSSILPDMVEVAYVPAAVGCRRSLEDTEPHNRDESVDDRASTTTGVRREVPPADSRQTSSSSTSFGPHDPCGPDYPSSLACSGTCNLSIPCRVPLSGSPSSSDVLIAAPLMVPPTHVPHQSGGTIQAVGHEPALHTPLLGDPRLSVKGPPPLVFFPTHRMILGAHCSYFDSLFSDRWHPVVPGRGGGGHLPGSQETLPALQEHIHIGPLPVHTLPCGDAEVFAAVLHYMYVGGLPQPYKGRKQMVQEDRCPGPLGGPSIRFQHLSRGSCSEACSLCARARLYLRVYQTAAALLMDHLQMTALAEVQGMIPDMPLRCLLVLLADSLTFGMQQLVDSLYEHLVTCHGRQPSPSSPSWSSLSCLDSLSHSAGGQPHEALAANLDRRGGLQSTGQEGRCNSNIGGPTRSDGFQSCVPTGDMVVGYPEWGQLPSTVQQALMMGWAHREEDKHDSGGRGHGDELRVVAPRACCWSFMSPQTPLVQVLLSDLISDPS